MSKPDNMEERLELLKLYEASVAADRAHEDAPRDMPEAEYAALAIAARNADTAYVDYPLAGLVTGYEGDVLFCGACEAPLLEDDELLEDAHTGELFLRSALGLPPRPAEEEGQEMPDMAEAV